jgi:hypothetical protein
MFHSLLQSACQWHLLASNFEVSGQLQAFADNTTSQQRVLPREKADTSTSPKRWPTLISGWSLHLQAMLVDSRFQLVYSHLQVILSGQPGLTEVRRDHLRNFLTYHLTVSYVIHSYPSLLLMLRRAHLLMGRNGVVVRTAVVLMVLPTISMSNKHPYLIYVAA